MKENEKVILDWVHLPMGVTADSLWDVLHDARLYFVTSDRLARTATLSFEIFYLDDDITVTFELNDVTSLRAVRTARWPGVYERPEGMSRTEEAHHIAEYQSKWREESFDWAELEMSLGIANRSASDDQDCLDISGANVVQRGSEITLHLQGNLQSSDLWHELFLRGSYLKVVRSDNAEFSLAQLVALGETWWGEFAERKID